MEGKARESQKANIHVSRFTQIGIRAFRIGTKNDKEYLNDSHNFNCR